MKFIFYREDKRFIGLGYGERTRDAVSMAAEMKENPMGDPEALGYDVVARKTITERDEDMLLCICRKKPQVSDVGNALR